MKYADRPDCIEKADAKEMGLRFMGLPDRWLESPTWRCENGHISTFLLKSEMLGRSVCLECKGRVWLTFPEDKESELK